MNASTTLSRSAAKNAPNLEYHPLAFADLPGWADDDHLAAFETFLSSCDEVIATVRAGGNPGKRAPHPGQLSACEEAKRVAAAKPSRADARAFFERNFTPHTVTHDGTAGLLTGYYEPVVQGSRTKSAKFSAAILKRPSDLVNLVSEADRGAVGAQMTHARKRSDGTTEAFATREEIDRGALETQNLELIYLRDEVAVYVMQVQGSGQVRLDDGTAVRITYDGKNGYPYTSIGQYLIETKQFPAHRMSMAALGQWLREDLDRGRTVMWQNKSYIFFREIPADVDQGPIGVMGISLSPGRSLALDTGFHAIGMPVYVSAPELRHATPGDGGFHRLMVAQDVGSAIKGPERGDIFFGSGAAAGKIAGVTKHAGRFFVLLPVAPRGATMVAGETVASDPMKQARK